MNDTPHERIAVACEPTADGWSCAVDVVNNESTTHHVVTLSRAQLERYGNGTRDPEAVVDAAFRFLLQREHKESILRRFAIGEIERYFPEFGYGRER